MNGTSSTARLSGPKCDNDRLGLLELTERGHVHENARRTRWHRAVVLLDDGRVESAPRQSTADLRIEAPGNAERSDEKREHKVVQLIDHEGQPRAPFTQCRSVFESTAWHGDGAGGYRCFSAW